MSGPNQYKVKPRALVKTETPATLAILRSVTDELVLDGGAPEDARQMPNPTAASSVRLKPPGGPTNGCLQPVGEQAPVCLQSGESELLGIAKDERGQSSENGYLEHAGHEPCRRADLPEPEEPDSQRQQISAECRESQHRAGGRGEPATGHDNDHTQAAGAYRLNQEEPPHLRIER